jgi:tetratricopeptide (TPR) repeat protein
MGPVITHSEQALMNQSSNKLSRPLSILLTSICLLGYACPSNNASAESGTSETWETIQRRGTNALDANKYWIAEPTLKQAMAQAELFNPKDIRLAKSLSELGRLYTIRGRFEEAECYLEEELSIRELVLGNDRFKCIPTMGSLIQFYLNYGTASKAAPLTEELLALVEGKLDEARSGSTKTILKKGQPLQAWLGVAAPVAVDPIIEWAITCDAVGKTHATHKNYALARRLFNAALDVKTTVLGNNHLSLANSYDSLGDLCMDKNDFDQAESFYTDALNITEKTLYSESPEVYNRLDKLAKCRIRQGKYGEAEKLYLRAQSFWKNEPTKNNNEARVMFALGSLYVQEHKYEAALPYLQKALQLAEEVNGPNSITVVPYLQKYAYALYYLGRKPEMEQYTARAASISGPPPPKIEPLKAKAETI